MTVQLLNRVENIVANGGDFFIAHHEQFHLCHNVFKCRLLQRHLKACSTCGKGLRHISTIQISLCFCAESLSLLFLRCFQLHNYERLHFFTNKGFVCAEGSSSDLTQVPIHIKNLQHRTENILTKI